MIKEVDIVSANPFAKRIEYIIDNKCIGYLEYSYIYDRIEIDNIFVLEEYRSNGIGSMLLAYLINVAKNKKVVNITLEVRVSNSVAIGLYKKYGFIEEAIRKYYYGDEDGILMKLDICS